VFSFVGFASAGFFGDTWNKITGNVVDGNEGCIDTERGMNSYIKGSIEGYLSWEMNEIGALGDRCMQEVMGSDGKFNGAMQYVSSCEENCGVDEAFCNKENTYGSTLVIKCPGGCEDGACIENNKEVDGECTDTDGGLDYFTKGETAWVDNKERIGGKDTDFLP